MSCNQNRAGAADAVSQVRDACPVDRGPSRRKIRQWVRGSTLPETGLALTLSEILIHAPGRRRRRLAKRHRVDLPSIASAIRALAARVGGTASNCARSSDARRNNARGAAYSACGALAPLTARNTLRDERAGPRRSPARIRRSCGNRVYIPTSPTILAPYPRWPRSSS